MSGEILRLVSVTSVLYFWENLFMDQMGFYEVFPNMNTEKDLSNALSDATVTKVSTGR